MNESANVVQNPCVVYHGSCVDGFMSALLVKNYFARMSISPCMVSCQYGKQQTDVVEDIIGRSFDTLYIVDFSFSLSLVHKLAANIEHLLILDHHKTAKEELVGKDLPTNVKLIFDMERSGAGITWDHFYKGEKRPEYVNWVEDRDLWRFNYETSKAFHAMITSYPYDFDLWNGLLIDDVSVSLIDEGLTILRYRDQKIEDMAKQAHECWWTLSDERIAPIDCIAVNAPYFMASDLGEYHKQDATFVVTYQVTPDGTVLLSFRSKEFDVSQLAKSLGGGGHRNAAGASCSWKNFKAYVGERK